jgi:hypothetical protein
LKKTPELWKTFPSGALPNMSQIAVVGNSFSARSVRYSLGIGRVFG